MMMPDVADSDGGSQDENGEEKVKKKTFTKRSIKEPIERLLTALRKLCFKLNNTGKKSLS